MKNLHKLNRKQAGMTMYEMMFMLIVAGFAATAAVKLIHHYIDNNVVKNAIDDIKTSYSGTDMQEVKDNDIKSKLYKYFEVNMVDDVIAKSAKITRDKKSVILSIDYEIRTGFIGNVDLVMVFKNEVDLAK